MSYIATVFQYPICTMTVVRWGYERAAFKRKCRWWGRVLDFMGVHARSGAALIRCKKHCQCWVIWCPHLGVSGVSDPTKTKYLKVINMNDVAHIKLSLSGLIYLWFWRFLPQLLACEETSIFIENCHICTVSIGKLFISASSTMANVLNNSAKKMQAAYHLLQSKCETGHTGQ